MANNKKKKPEEKEDKNAWNKVYNRLKEEKEIEQELGEGESIKRGYEYMAEEKKKKKKPKESDKKKKALERLQKSIRDIFGIEDFEE